MTQWDVEFILKGKHFKQGDLRIAFRSAGQPLPKVQEIIMEQSKNKWPEEYESADQTSFRAERVPK